MIKYILFDLDGTLIDSSEGITKAFEYALNFFGIEVENRSELNKVIGPPLRESFIKWYNFNKQTAEEAITKFREYYSEKGVNENELYEGIKGLLEKLKERNKVLIIATSKPQNFTERILKKHEIIQYFDFVSGATLDCSREKKTEVIKYAIQNMNIKDINECIMIGDKRQDVNGAKENNMKSIGVTYGFGTKEELINSKPTYIVNNVKDLGNLLEKQ